MYASPYSRRIVTEIILQELGKTYFYQFKELAMCKSKNQKPKCEQGGCPACKNKGQQQPTNKGNK